MSAIGVDGFNTKAFLIGAHADHRPNDYVFPRTQSPAFREAEWESRIRPMLSWGEIAGYGLAAFASVVVLAVIA